MPGTENDNEVVGDRIRRNLGATKGEEKVACNVAGVLHEM